MKKALVTGSSRGIGAAEARALAADGWRVTINYLNSRERAEALAAELGTEAVRADVAEPAQVRAMFEAAGPFELLVCNAGLRPQVTTPYDLGGRTVTLPAGSSYAVRLANLHSETGDTVKVRIEPKVTAYQLICRADADTAVMTVAGDRLVAMAADSCDNIAWFEIGFEQNVSFATTHKAVALGDSLDTWLARMEEDAAYRRLCSGYLGGEVVR